MRRARASGPYGSGLSTPPGSSVRNITWKESAGQHRIARIVDLRLSPRAFSHLPPAAGRGAGVAGRARRARPSGIVGQTERRAAVPRKQLESVPGGSEVSRTLDGHGGGPRGPEHQNHVGQAEPRLQVQPDLVPPPGHGGARTRRPPRIRMRERVVGHVSGRVGVLWAEEVGGHMWGARPAVEGAVPTAARVGEEGPAARQVPDWGAAGVVHTSGD